MRLPRWLKWEFWPFWLFYTPVYIYLILRSIRHGSLSFFTAANPGMEYGGFVENSKQETLDTLDSSLVPISIRYEKAPSKKQILNSMEAHNLNFPIILKPDIGERGYGVERIDSEDQLEPYLEMGLEALLLQEYIPWELEYGVMIVRDPRTMHLEITSIVVKEPLEVRGDGESTLWELILASDRGWYHRKLLQELIQDRLSEVPDMDQRVVLVSIGNHSRGSTFRNGNYLRSEKLRQTFDAVSAQIPGFFLGRFDVKARDFAALEAGEFKIMEVNGVNSEPAHIYDPEMNLFTGWRDLLKHWQYIFYISRVNIKNGARPVGSRELVRAIKTHYANQKSGS